MAAGHEDPMNPLAKSDQQETLFKGTLHNVADLASEIRPASSTTTLYLLHFLAHATRVRLDEALRPLGLSSFHYTVLSVLVRNEGMSSSKLSRRFHVTPQTMGEVIALLERKGLISRSEEAANRRVLRLALTADGRQAVVAAAALVADIESQVFATLSGAERARLQELVGKVVTALRDAGEEETRNSAP